MDTFDLTPDPKVLIALTHTPMQPLDALCELVDNSIDSFQIARLRGLPIDDPLVVIDLPRRSELDSGAGAVRVRDNGPGLDAPTAERAIRAGFSGNNPYDSLGLFGMGFNISTGKLGRTTRFVTAVADDAEAVEVLIDLDRLRETGSYAVPYSRVPKQEGFVSGTDVAVTDWWPEGSPNAGFVRKLVQYGLPTVRAELGRRYSTLLREERMRIVVNGEKCDPFEHCVWDDARFVERRGLGQIPAVFRFDETVGMQRRCVECAALVTPGLSECPECGSANTRTVEERIRGWLGIQRFDDTTEFGIDLIRNGRTIRVGEKQAFFEYVDDLKRTIKDYPIDSTFGRIVGEVHLNHVPVDFLKQDFQRSSPEWQRSMQHLRGESSLQPSKPGAEENSSPLFRLYQGYRRVRRPGRADMYMGYWDPDANEPRRISRDVEREYLLKFNQRLPGYYDDSEWWKLVEEADSPPPLELVDCPNCSAQNLQGHDTCSACGALLIAKRCINPDCAEEIAQSAATCPVCGTSQVPEVEEPWRCAVCGATNMAGTIDCVDCGLPVGTPNPLSREHLAANSHKSDGLSIPGCSLRLADGGYSSKLDVEVYLASASLTGRCSGTAPRSNLQRRAGGDLPRSHPPPVPHAPGSPRRDRRDGGMPLHSRPEPPPLRPP